MIHCIKIFNIKLDLKTALVTINLHESTHVIGELTHDPRKSTQVVVEPIQRCSLRITGFYSSFVS